MKFKTLLISGILATYLLSCTHHDKGQNKSGNGTAVSGYHEPSPEDIAAKENVSTLDDLDKRLTQLADEAIKSGDQTIRYLASDLFLKGSAASMQGDFQTAALLYKYVLKLNPKDDFVKFKYAVELIRVGNITDSQKFLAELFEVTKGSDEKVGLLLAGTYTALENPDKARVVYKAVLKNHPKNEDACIFLAKSYAVDGHKDKAVATISRCEKKIKTAGVFSYYRGKMAMEEGKRKSAMKHFKRSLRVEPSFYQAAVALGLLYEEKKDYKQALKLYEKFLKNSPSDSVVLGKVVNLLFALGKYKDVIPYAETLSSIDPTNLNLKVKLGILYTETSKFDMAKSVFQDILKAVPESDKVLYYLGALFQETKEFEQSIEYFHRIPVTSGLYLDSSLQIAQMLSALALKDKASGKNEGEKKLFSFIDKRYNEKSPLAVEFLVIKASYFEGILEYKMASDTLEKAKPHASFSSGHKYYLASLLEKQKRYGESIDIVQAILKDEPKNAHAWNFLGYSLLVQGKELKKALSYIKKAVELKPNDGYIRDSLGWYYYKTGNFDKALVQLKEAYKKVSNDPVITKHLGIVYESLKKYKMAKRFYVEALKNSRHEGERSSLMEAVKNLEDKRSPASEGPTK
ncbi:MAG: tetratricopeptide repeat protein [Bacteriovoracaceae bacterium]|jgi:tetratricopeptide (TPR) repeat protein|nr:tetratricopeptide repeat protein [Bacteriovoracaceae bacterium]